MFQKFFQKLVHVYLFVYLFIHTQSLQQFIHTHIHTINIQCNSYTFIIPLTYFPFSLYYATFCVFTHTLYVLTFEFWRILPEAIRQNYKQSTPSKTVSKYDKSVAFFFWFVVVKNRKGLLLTCFSFVCLQYLQLTPCLFICCCCCCFHRALLLSD